LHEGVTVVGRGEDCAFSLDDPSVSRAHARLSIENGALSITDLRSSNGTFVNGERLAHTSPLRSGDVIALGDTMLKVAASESADFSPVAPGIEIIEQTAPRPQSEISTEPQFSSIEVLESLVVNAQVAEDPAALAQMIRMSVDRLLAMIHAKRQQVGRDNAARLLSIVEIVASWSANGEHDAWVREVTAKLQS
jgi:pSer/pThr/pTyr-binding forkhead associated (FHA) protein